MVRIQKIPLANLMTEIKKDILSTKYESDKEKVTFFRYTKLPLRFIVLAVISMTLAILLYYVNGLNMGLQIARENSSIGYQLPYKTLVLVNLNNSKTYALICTYQFMIIPSIIFGYVGFDCMFVNLSIQIIAQFAILSLKVNKVLNISENFHEGIKTLVLRHYQLLRFAEQLEVNFNMAIMQQLLGTTIHLCISGYHLLMSTETKQLVTMILFVLYGFCVISTLFIYCYIGECLIEESTKFCNALYNYEWYNMSTIDSKYVFICMIRTNKPQCLTSGKFIILSLRVFSDVGIVHYYIL
ncbi:hypothetical protein M0802_016175 [Mischocyttarus mexicanus]|nr:hypothetical protein M0802_016175 [Mischocyttarus mexicanus]